MELLAKWEGTKSMLLFISQLERPSTYQVFIDQGKLSEPYSKRVMILIGKHAIFANRDTVFISLTVLVSFDRTP